MSTKKDETPSDLDIEELFELHNGQYVADPNISAKIAKVKAIKPESHQVNSTDYTKDESGMAELFADIYNQEVAYCPERKSWYTYTDGVWKYDNQSIYVSGKIREFVRILALYCGEIIDEDTRKTYMKFVSSMGDRRFRDRIMKDAQYNLVKSASEFDDKPYLINCLNGTYDLEKKEFREHSWQDFLTMRTNFEYTVQSSPRFERWEQFVSEVCCGDKDKADFLQRALGYSILGTSKEECMFILHGKTTRNGKSTMLGAIEWVLGDYARVADVAIICKGDRSKSADAASPALAALKGKRFVTMAENDQYGKLDEETIKQLTGGEKITARNLYESSMTFLPQFTMWLSCNDLPAVRDKSLFASDRIKVIEFNRHFSAEERDETLKDLFKTPEAMKGIFYWLICGYAKYQRQGLKMSADMQKVIKKYEKDNDLVLQFLDEKCERDETEYLKCKSLYDSYKIWCKSNGYFVASARKFYSGLDQHPEWVDGKVKRDGYDVYKGIKFRS